MSLWIFIDILMLNKSVFATLTALIVLEEIELVVAKCTSQESDGIKLCAAVLQTTLLHGSPLTSNWPLRVNNSFNEVLRGFVRPFSVIKCFWENYLYSRISPLKLIKL